MWWQRAIPQSHHSPRTDLCSLAIWGTPGSTWTLVVTLWKADCKRQTETGWLILQLSGSSGTRLKPLGIELCVSKSESLEPLIMDFATGLYSDGFKGNPNPALTNHMNSIRILMPSTQHWHSWWPLWSPPHQAHFVIWNFDIWSCSCSELAPFLIWYSNTGGGGENSAEL